MLSIVLNLSNAQFYANNSDNIGTFTFISCQCYLAILWPNYILVNYYLNTTFYLNCLMVSVNLT